MFKIKYLIEMVIHHGTSIDLASANLKSQCFFYAINFIINNVFNLFNNGSICYTHVWRHEQIKHSEIHGV